MDKETELASTGTTGTASTGTTGGASTGTIGGYTKLRFARLEARKASNLHIYSADASKGVRERFLPLLWLFSGTLLELNTAWGQQTQGRTKPLGSLHVECRHSGKYSFIWVKNSGDMCCSKPLRRSKWKTRMLAPGKTRRTGSLEEGTKVSTAVLSFEKKRN